MPGKKLERLHVQNLGPIKEAVIDGRAPVTLLLGPNEAGKSTLLEALQVLYFGARGGIDVKDNAALTRDGERGWKITATIDGAELSGTRSSRPTREQLSAVLGDARVFRAIAESGSFLTMTPEKRRELLADLSSTGTEQLALTLEKEEAPGEIVNAVRDGHLKRALAGVVDLRRAADTILKQLKALAEAAVEDVVVETKQGPKPISTIPMDKVDQVIRTLTNARDEALRALAAREAGSRALQAAEEAKVELANLSAEVAWTEGDESALHALARRIEDERTKTAAASLTIANASKSIDTLTALRTKGGECPLCRSKLSTGDAEAHLTAEINRLVGEVNEARKVQKAGADIATELEGTRKTKAAQRETAREQRSVRNRLENIIVAAEKLGAPPAPEHDPKALQEELDRLMAMRDKRRDYETALAARKRAAGTIGGQQARRDQLARWEALVDPSAMDDEGGSLQRLNAHLDDYSTALFGAPSVRLTTGYELKVQDRAPGLSSTSAAIRAGFVCSLAIAAVSGVGMAFLDQFEAMDAANRKKLLGLVKRLVVEDVVGTVLIAAVKDEPKAGAKLPWLAWTSVRSGTLTYLED